MTYLKILALLFIFLPAKAQNTEDYKKLEDLYQQKAYYKCLKLSEKFVRKYESSAIPPLFKSLALCHLGNHKKVLKKYKNPDQKSLEAMLMARSRDKAGKHLLPYKDRVKEFQESFFSKAWNLYQSYIKAQFALDSMYSDDSKSKALELKAGKDKKQAENIFNTLYKLFDNSAEVYESFHDSENDYINEDYKFKEWDNPLYRVCNTARDADYMSIEEKQMIYITNLARLNPKLFNDTYLKKYPSGTSEGYYLNSLRSDLETRKPSFMLFPDPGLYKAAAFHAEDMGKAGMVGHQSSDGTLTFTRIRNIAKTEANGENCSYGLKEPLAVILQLLIDAGIESLGHRKNQLEPGFRKVGVAMRPHKTYGYNVVFDFR